MELEREKEIQRNRSRRRHGEDGRVNGCEFDSDIYHFHRRFLHRRQMRCLQRRRGKISPPFAVFLFHLENWQFWWILLIDNSSFLLDCNLIHSQTVLQEELEWGLSKVSFFPLQKFSILNSLASSHYNAYLFSGKAQKPLGYETPFGLARSTERKGNRLQVLPELPPPSHLS